MMQQCKESSCSYLGVKIADLNAKAGCRSWAFARSMDAQRKSLLNQRSETHQSGSGIQVPWLSSFINWKEQIDETDSVNLGNFVDD